MLFEKERKLAETSKENRAYLMEIISHEIEIWINFLMDILIKDENVDLSSKLIVKILKKSEKSQYTKQIAIEKVCDQ